MSMEMPDAQLDHLDNIAEAIRAKKRGARDLAASDMRLAPAGHTIASALSRLGGEDICNLVNRWRYK